MEYVKTILKQSTWTPETRVYITTTTSTTTIITTPMPTAAPAPVYPKNCSTASYRCDVGWKNKEGDLLCRDNSLGCDTEYCCDQTCGLFHECPKDYGFWFDPNGEQERCKQDTCEYKQCCQFNMTVLKSEESVWCSNCTNSSIAQRAISFNMTYQNIDLSKMLQDSRLTLQFTRAVVWAVAKTVGPEFRQDSISLEFVPVSTAAQVFIFANKDSVEAAYTDLVTINRSLSTVALNETMQDLLPDMSSVATGVVVVGSVTHTVMVNVRHQDRVGFSVPPANEGMFTNVVNLLGGQAVAVPVFSLLALVSMLMLYICLAQAPAENEDEDLQNSTSGIVAKEDRPAAALVDVLHAGEEVVTSGGGSSAQSGSGTTSNAYSTTAPSRQARAERVVPPQINVKLCGEGSYEYNNRDEPPRASQLYGQWNSSLLYVGKDFASLGCACFCFPLFVPWRMHHNIDRIGTVHTPTGKIDAGNVFLYSFLVVILWLAGLVMLEQTISCTEGEGMCINSDLKFSNTDPSSGVRVTFFFLLLCPLPYRVYVMHKAIMTRFHITEDEGVTFLKSACFFCLSSLQAGRHVDSYYLERGTPAPKLPIIGKSVKVKRLKDVDEQGEVVEDS